MCLAFDPEQGIVARIMSAYRAYVAQSNTIILRLWGKMNSLGSTVFCSKKYNN